MRCGMAKSTAGLYANAPLVSLSSSLALWRYGWLVGVAGARGRDVWLLRVGGGKKGGRGRGGRERSLIPLWPKTHNQSLSTQST